MPTQPKPGVSNPSLNLLITPVWDRDVATALSFAMTVESPSLKTNETLISIPLAVHGCPSQPYTEKSLRASDTCGPLGLVTFPDEEDKNHLTWKVQRPTSGTVKIEFLAFPRKVDRETLVASRADLRSDSGGLQGAGISMIPLPPASSRIAQQQFDLSVTWNLGNAPRGTRALWTFGEGPQTVHRIGVPGLLASSIYAVGPIRSLLPAEGEEHEEDAAFGAYWFGDLPSNIAEALHHGPALFHGMSLFFNDPPSASNPYRIFIRRSFPARGFGGSAFTRCYMIEYDATISKIPASNILQLLAHEMVHNWPTMGKFTDIEDVDDDDGKWYTEGTAEFYTGVILYRLNIIPKSRFVAYMNSILSAYYTNPEIHISNRKAHELEWATMHAQMLIYSRGFAYLLKINGQMLKASNGERNVDDLVQKFLQRKNNGLSFDVADWLVLIEEELGSSAVAEYRAMENGEIVVPEENCLGPDLSLARFDQEMMDFGFDIKSFRTREICGLKPGSRAAEAGVQEGDIIVENDSLWDKASDFNAEMTMLLRRPSAAGDVEFEVRYWPRTHDKVMGHRLVAL